MNLRDFVSDTMSDITGKWLYNGNCCECILLDYEFCLRISTLCRHWWCCEVSTEYQVTISEFPLIVTRDQISMTNYRMGLNRSTSSQIWLNWRRSKPTHWRHIVENVLANLSNRYSALCWRPVTHAQTWASYSALYRFGRLSNVLHIWC